MTSVSTDRRQGLNSGAAVKVPCRAATTANITLSGEKTIDGVALVTGDRVLVKNQTDTTANGIYVVDTGDWSRDADFDGTFDAVQGTAFYVNAGTQLGFWRLATANPIAIGTTSLSFTQALVSDASTISYTPSWLGAIARTIQSWFSDRVSILDFIPTAEHAAIFAGTSATDLTTYIQAFLTYLATKNRRGYVPRGIYPHSTEVSLTGVSATKFGVTVIIDGEGYGPDGDKPGSIFKWTGTDDIGNVQLRLVGIYYVEMNNVSLYGASKVGNVVKVSVGTNGYAPQGWTFNNCRFEGAKAGTIGGKVFYITDTTNCNAFKFNGTHIIGGSALPDGLVSDNQNAVSTTITGGAVSNCRRGIWINGGSFNADGLEFSQNSVADVYLQIHSPITMRHCWTEQSRQFIVSDVRQQFSPLTLEACTSSSFPWSYWKLDEAGRAQPTNDYSQWISILWDGARGALNMIGCALIDPANGAASGAVAPTTASTITASCTNGSSPFPPDMNNVGSFSQNGTNSFTSQFWNVGTSNLSAPKFLSRKRFSDGGNFSGAGTIIPYNYSTVLLTLTGDGTLTFAASPQSDPDDEVTVILKQDGTGGRRADFLSGELTNGRFVPDPTPGAKSSITFRWDGTSWVERSRDIGIAGITKRMNEPVVFKDDFLGDVIADEWNTRVGSDGACVASAILANQARGFIRATTGAGAGATYAVNGTQLDSQLNWRADQGGLVCEFRVALSAITNVALFIGLTDQVAALEMPFTLGAADALTSNATDAVGILFDTGADTDNWWLVGVAADVDAAKQNSAFAPVAATMEVWRIEVTAAGAASFYRNGTLVGASMAGAVTATAVLTPVIAAFARAAASRNVDADYSLVQANR